MLYQLKEKEKKELRAPARKKKRSCRLGNGKEGERVAPTEKKRREKLIKNHIGDKEGEVSARRHRTEKEGELLILF